MMWWNHFAINVGSRWDPLLFAVFIIICSFIPAFGLKFKIIKPPKQMTPEGSNVYRKYATPQTYDPRGVARDVHIDVPNKFQQVKGYLSIMIHVIRMRCKYRQQPPLRLGCRRYDAYAPSEAGTDAEMHRKPFRYGYNMLWTRLLR